MELRAPVALCSDARAHLPLQGVALQRLCALAWLGVAWAFSFLDRGRGDFAFFAIGWVVVGAVGFGPAVLRHDRAQANRRWAGILTALAGLFTLFPGFLMYSLPRWAALGLLLMTAARAAAMATRRDLYYCVAAIVAVSLLVLTNDRAQWTIWFYLAPAWGCIALVLAWDYAGDVPLGAGVKAALTCAFLALCIALGVALSAAVPLPQLRGFGFLEPGTTNPGRVELPAGSGGSSDGAGAKGRGEAAGLGTAQPTRLGDVVQRLREALADPGLPQWQRGTVRAMLAVAEAMARVSGDRDARLRARPMTARERADAEARAASVRVALQALWNALLLALAMLLLWLLRWRIAMEATSAAAALLARWRPGLSMRCSMLALRCLLHRHGHRLEAGQSLLEHVESARMLPAGPRGWLRNAVQDYGAWRFGGAPATGAASMAIRRALVAAEEALRQRRTG